MLAVLTIHTARIPKRTGTGGETPQRSDASHTSLTVHDAPTGAFFCLWQVGK